MPAKIRVLLAIGEMTGGGSQRQLLYILQRLDRSRFEPQLYVITSGGDLLPEVPPDVPVHFFDRTYRPPAWRYPGQAHRARARHLARVLQKQGIDCLYDRTYHMTLIAAAATRHRFTPRISVVVTDPQQDFETNPERFRWVKRLLLKRAYQTADCVVGVSHGVRQAAIDRYQLDATKTRTIYNGFDIERIDRLMLEPLPPDQQKQPGTFEIVAAGRLHPQKGFGDLLTAVHDLIHHRGLAQVRLRILGVGPLEGDLRAQASQLNLAEHVVFAGFRANPLPYYRQADLFCLSSLYEGLPNALVEAILCKTPVVATDCKSGPREVLAHGAFGRLVSPANPTALAAALADHITNPAPSHSLLDPARHHIETTFSLPASIHALESALAALIKKG